MGTLADIDELMYRCGLDVLHPGGLEGTDRLARMCGVSRGMKVLDIGCGRGTTACHLARHFGCTVVGLDRSARMIESARAKARELDMDDRVDFIEGNALDLPFADGHFDVVLSECTTTLLDVEKAFAQFLRVVKPGGAVGDSDMVWREPPPEGLADTIAGLWEGFRTMTLPQWKAFFETHGLADVQTAAFTETVWDMEKGFAKELGAGGMMRAALMLVGRPDLRHAVGEYRKLTQQYGEYFGYGAVAGRKA